ncbi:MAG: ABC transporter ATP-binding protein [Rhodospirillales bacterium]|nr:ABC transporter ATP-binding protein [Rhodospirillales bacterium]
MAEPLLVTEALSKRFQGLAAVNNVALSFEAGRVHAVIGPNGAGKTTLINLLSGELPPTSGRILLRGRDITGLPAHRIARLGLGRSFQRTNIFPQFTCRQNCWLGAQARLPSSMRFFRPARRFRAIGEAAERALEVCGLAARAETPAASLSYGEQRQLELAMLLASEPEILLLDEPLAGMGPEESWRVVELLRSLAKTHTLILVEHDMDAVFAISEQITVMVNGEVLETGSPEAIRASSAVQEAYLGREEAAA